MRAWFLRIYDPNGVHDTVFVGPYARRVAEATQAAIEMGGEMEVAVEFAYTTDQLGDAVFRHKNGVDREFA